jgi:uncharacterized protein YggE
MNNQEQVWKIGKVVGIMLAVFLAVLSIKEVKSIGYVGKEFPATNAITVSGKGEAVSIPNIATFSFTVSENAKTVKEAQDKATEKINNALKAVKAGGVAEKDIKTLSYSINPHYEYNQPACTSFGCPGGKQVLTGYDVVQTIEVKVRDLTKAGSLFDTIGTAGIQTVNGLTFSIDDIDSVKALARADAITKAKAKAKIISKDLGVRLVRITNYYEQTYPYAREAAMGGDVMTLKASVAPQIPTGEQKITSTVSITYEIR